MPDLEDDRERRRRGARRWMSIGVATVVMVLSDALVVFGFAAASDDETAFAGGVLGIGLGLVPGVFLALAALSDRERPIRASAAATGLWLVVGGPVALLDISVGLAAGFGAGGVIALRREPDHQPGFRVVAIAIAVVYTALARLVVPPAAVLVAATMPLVVLGLADMASEREARADRNDPGLASP